MLKSIDLFAGAGGLSHGLISEGFDVVAAVEIDPTSVKSYSLNHEKTNIIIDDIRKVSGPSILKQVGISAGELDLLTGCPPCQAFSSLRTRKRKQNRDYSSKSLIIEMLRLIRSIRPKAIILENVPGLANDEHFLQFLKKCW